MSIHTKHITASVTKTDTAEGIVEAIVSTDTIDRYGEIVEQVWNLDAYRRNPVVLFAHDPHELPIGRADAIDVVDGKLRATIRFAPTKRGAEVHELFKSGTLSAFSVGFRPGSVRTEQRDGREVRILSNNELLEISAVAVPANPDAVAVEVRMAPITQPSKRHHVVQTLTGGKRWADYTPVQLHAIAVRDPERFAQLLDAQRRERRARYETHPQCRGGAHRCG